MDPVSWTLIAATAIGAAGTGYSAYEAQKVRPQDSFAGMPMPPAPPPIPEMPSMPAMPERPALAEMTRATELQRQGERRRRASTLLTGAGGAMVSGSNVARSLLGQ